MPGRLLDFALAAYKQGSDLDVTETAQQRIIRGWPSDGAKT